MCRRCNSSQLCPILSICLLLSWHQSRFSPLTKQIYFLLLHEKVLHTTFYDRLFFSHMKFKNSSWSLHRSVDSRYTVRILCFTKLSFPRPLIHQFYSNFLTCSFSYCHWSYWDFNKSFVVRKQKVTVTIINSTPCITRFKKTRKDSAVVIFVGRGTQKMVQKNISIYVLEALTSITIFIYVESSQ